MTFERKALFLTMVHLKEKLIKRIRATEDSDVLKEIYRLLEIDLDDQDIYELSNEQIIAIEEAQGEISQGKYLTNDEANATVKEWLAKK